MTVPHTTEAAFGRDVLESPVPVLVDVTADWCGPCRAMAPILEAITDERDDLRIVKVDADTNMSLATALGVRGFPTFVLFDGGQDRGRITGAMPKLRFAAAIDELLAGARA